MFSDAEFWEGRERKWWAWGGLEWVKWVKWVFSGGVGWMMRASGVVVGVFFGGEVGGKVYFFEKKCVFWVDKWV